LIGYAQNPNQEWRRLWKYSRGKKFVSHEPPILEGAGYYPMVPYEAENLDVVFRHEAYADYDQLKRKCQYYGYGTPSFDNWHNYLHSTEERIPVERILPWAPPTGVLVRYDFFNKRKAA
jgi:hypothetical protein